jgi:demethylmenaquinone methyltransferase / 2-methoxy-6-polyprenyl-1,4-benzoquinol methylase
MNLDPPHLSREGSGDMFDRIAARYDLLNRVMSLGMDCRWRHEAVRALGLREGHRVLDLATGTADLALAVACQGEHIRVTGLDPSRAMLEIGARKIERKGLGGRVELVVGDAQSLPYPDQSYDGLCMAFGIRNVPDRTAALREMARVVRLGGRISLLELSEPGEGWFAVPARWYVHRVLPFLGALLSGAQEYRSLQRSIEAFPAAKEFARQMNDAGLEVLEVRSLGFGACHLYVARPKEARS